MPKKRPLTLLEVLISIALLAIALGFVALPISKVLAGGRFERAVKQVIARIEIAQEMMLDFRTDVHLTLEQDDEGIVCNLQAGRKLPSYLEKLLNLHERIRGVERIAFNGSSSGSIDLYFDGTLGAIPVGEITLFYRDRDETLLLRGYPAQIKRGKDVEEKICEANYPEEVVSII